MARLLQERIFDFPCGKYRVVRFAIGDGDDWFFDGESVHLMKFNQDEGNWDFTIYNEGIPCVYSEPESAAKAFQALCDLLETHNGHIENIDLRNGIRIFYKSPPKKKPRRIGRTSNGA